MKTTFVDRSPGLEKSYNSLPKPSPAIEVRKRKV